LVTQLFSYLKFQFHVSHWFCFVCRFSWNWNGWHLLSLCPENTWNWSEDFCLHPHIIMDILILSRHFMKTWVLHLLMFKKCLHCLVSSVEPYVVIVCSRKSFGVGAMFREYSCIIHGRSHILLAFFLASKFSRLFIVG